MDDVRRAYARAAKRRERAARRAGIRTLRVPIEEAQPLLLALLEKNNWTLAQAGQALSINPRTVYEIKHGIRASVDRTTYDALHSPEVIDGDRIDIYRTRQLLWSLRAIGYNLTSVAGESGVSERGLRNMFRPEARWTRRATFEKIRDAYNRIGDTVGPDVRAVNLAKAQGWLAPIFYDDAGNLIIEAVPGYDERERARTRDRRHRDARGAVIKTTGRHRGAVAK